MGTKAIKPFETPSALPSEVPKPPNVFPTTPVTPFSRQDFVVLSYVAPRQYGLPTHESIQMDKLGVTLRARAAWRIFVLQITW